MPWIPQGKKSHFWMRTQDLWCEKTRAIPILSDWGMGCLYPVRIHSYGMAKRDVLFAARAFLFLLYIHAHTAKVATIKQTVPDAMSATGRGELVIERVCRCRTGILINYLQTKERKGSTEPAEL